MLYSHTIEYPRNDIRVTESWTFNISILVLCLTMFVGIHILVLFGILMGMYCYNFHCFIRRAIDVDRMYYSNTPYMNDIIVLNQKRYGNIYFPLLLTITTIVLILTSSYYLIVIMSFLCTNKLLFMYYRSELLRWYDLTFHLTGE